MWKYGIFLVTMLVYITASTISAQETVYLNYQGRLTDDTGIPLTATVSITFSIYDNTGYAPAKWSQSYADVEVSNGLFNVNLGPIPDTVFNGEDRYLGIQIEADPEISPRTLLTSAPSAAYAKQMAGGDVETGEGSLTVNTETGDPTIVLDAGQGRAVPSISMYAHPPEPVKVFEVNAGSEDEAGGSLNLYNEITKYMGLDPSPFNTGGNLRMYNTSGMGEQIFFELNTGQTAGASMSLHDEIGKRMGVEPSPFHPAYGITMYNPEIDPAAPYMELLVGANDGAIMNMYDDVGKWMGVEPVPFNSGGSIKLFNSSSVGPTPLVELIADNSEGGSINIHDEIGKRMGLEPTPFNSGYGLSIYNPNTSSPLIEMNGSPTDGGSFNIYDNVGRVMGFDPTPFNGGFSMTFRDPTGGDPSGEVLMDLRSIYGGRASYVTLQMYNPSSIVPANSLADLSADASGGFLRLGQSRGLDDYQTLFYGAAEPAVANFGLKGPAPVVDLLGPVIMMVVDDAEAKMGIGIADSDEALYVVGNIVATGNITAITDTKAKTNVEPINDALAIVEELQGVRYDWRDDFVAKMNAPRTKQIGLIAQDVEKVVPEIVLSPDEGYKSVDYSRLTAVLIEAVKELKAENDELRKRVERLEGR
jgi:hypothetical protein